MKKIRLLSFLILLPLCVNASQDWPAVKKDMATAAGVVSITDGVIMQSGIVYTIGSVQGQALASTRDASVYTSGTSETEPPFDVPVQSDEDKALVARLNASTDPCALVDQDFSGHNLTGLNVTGRDLFGSNFSGSTGLKGSDFDKAGNIAGVNFSGLDLEGLDFSHFPSLYSMNISGCTGVNAASMSGIYASYANFSGVDMTGYSGANVGSNLCFTDLSNCKNLNYSTFTNADFWGTNFSGTDLTGLKFTTNNIYLLEANLSNCTGLNTAELNGITNLYQTNLSGDDLTGFIPARSQDIYNTNFANCKGLTKTQLVNAGVDLSTCDVTGLPD